MLQHVLPHLDHRGALTSVKPMYALELAFDDVDDVGDGGGGGGGGDDDGKDSPRLAARPRHRELLTELYAEGRLLAAGPLPDDSGALVVFRGDRDEVESIIAADPYYSAPGVRIVSLREWNPIVGP